MKIEEHTKIEGGYVMGFVQTNMVGSKVWFQICTVEEWEDATEEEAEEMAKEALFGSGAMEWSY